MLGGTPEYPLWARILFFLGIACILVALIMVGVNLWFLSPTVAWTTLALMFGGYWMAHYALSNTEDVYRQRKQNKYRGTDE